MAGEASKREETEKKEPTIGFDNVIDPDVMIVTIPFKKWVTDYQYGEMLVNGAFEVFKRIAMQNLLTMRRKKIEANGIIRPRNTGGDSSIH